MKTLSPSLLLISFMIPAFTEAAELVLSPGQESTISSNTQTDVKCIYGESRSICRIKAGKSTLIERKRDVRIGDSGLEDRGMVEKNVGEEDVIILTLNDIEIMQFGRNQLGVEALRVEITRLQQQGICAFQP